MPHSSTESQNETKADDGYEQVCEYADDDAKPKLARREETIPSHEGHDAEGKPQQHGCNEAR
jgi:hypothetical protein